MMRSKKQVQKRPGGSTLDEDQITTVLSEQKEKSVQETQQPAMVLGYDCDEDDPEDDD